MGFLGDLIETISIKVQDYQADIHNYRLRYERLNEDELNRIIMNRRGAARLAAMMELKSR